MAPANDNIILGGPGSDTLAPKPTNGFVFGTTSYAKEPTTNGFVFGTTTYLQQTNGYIEQENLLRPAPPALK